MAARADEVTDPRDAEVRIVAMRRRHLRSVLKIERQVHPRPWSHGVFANELGQADRCYVVARVDGTVAKIAHDPDCVERIRSLETPLMQLCATYLLQRATGGAASLDPVARFHLNTGARLERINWLADTSKKGLRESLGLMVNYLYEPGEIEANHERFVQGEVVASRRVRGLASPG